MKIGSRFVLPAVVLGGCLCASAAEPRVARENIEWLDVWVPDTNAHGVPRVLLIGDSIVRGYGPQVEQRLKGTAHVARLATSKSVGDPALLAEIALVLDQYRFDVVHFNNGLHGWGYTEDEYRAAFPALLETLRAHARGAKLIWASTTPVRERDHLEQFSTRTERVKARNRIAAGVIGDAGLVVDDLFSVVMAHPEYYAQDGTHFNAKGTGVQADQVARTIREALR